LLPGRKELNTVHVHEHVHVYVNVDVLVDVDGFWQFVKPAKVGFFLELFCDASEIVREP